MRGRKILRVKSKKLKDWIKAAPDLSDYKFAGGRYTISYLLFFPDDRGRDGQNLMKVPLDYMVSQGVFIDDNRKIICGEQWFDGGIDREKPRVEITIKEYK